MRHGRRSRCTRDERRPHSRTRADGPRGPRVPRRTPPFARGGLDPASRLRGRAAAPARGTGRGGRVHVAGVSVAGRGPGWITPGAPRESPSTRWSPTRSHGGGRCTLRVWGDDDTSSAGCPRPATSPARRPSRSRGRPETRVRVHHTDGGRSHGCAFRPPAGTRAGGPAHPLQPQEQPLGQEQEAPCPHEQFSVMVPACGATPEPARQTFLTVSDGRSHRPGDRPYRRHAREPRPFTARRLRRCGLTPLRSSPGCRSFSMRRGGTRVPCRALAHAPVARPAGRCAPPAG